MSHRPVTRSQSTANLSLLLPTLVAVQAVSGVGVQIPFQAAHVPMAIQPQINFVTWDSGSPFITPTPPAQWGAIPTSALKELSKFIGDGSETPGENLQDVVNVCTIHNIIEQNVVLRLLTIPFKGKAQDWYKSIMPNSIGSWD